MFAYMIIAAVLTGLNAMARSRRAVTLISLCFYTAQAVIAVAAIMHTGAESLRFFTFDTMGVLFFALMSVVSVVAFYKSNYYLDTENLRQYKLYNISLMLLCVSAAGVYFANHIAVTWIFLEATTLSAAGLVYHRRSDRSLEATWKYIFVCSTGIAMAYLGILLLSTAAIGGDMSYEGLTRSVAGANPLYLKIAFLFIMVGYSCKMETFPFYTVGVDANFVAPTPASAVISTVIVNAGFVAFFRAYKIMAVSEVYGWISSVILIAGVVSVLIGAVYMRRTNNYKRFFAYSTVENMGIALIGLGVGGAGVFAAVFHVIAHTLIKSGIFFNVAQIGKIYGSYRINRIGNYMSVNRMGALSVLLGSVSLLALPPSALFISELLIFKEIIAGQRWVLLAVIVLLLCFVMYSLCSRVLQLCFKPVDMTRMPHHNVSAVVTWSGFLLIVASILLWSVRMPFVDELINSIIS